MQNLELASNLDAFSPLLKVDTISVMELQKYVNRDELFAVVDACDAPEVLSEIEAMEEGRAASLLKGTLHEHYWAVSPYLIQVNTRFFQWIGNKVQKQPWGIFLLSNIRGEELHRHLQSFLNATLPDQKKWFFRFYDPRVMQNYLSSCNIAELRAFFEFIQAYILNGTKQQDWTTFSLRENL